MRSLVEKTLRRIGEGSSIPFAVRFADGAEYRSRDAAPAFTLVFREPRAYWRIAAFGHVGLLEAYFDGDLDIEGSLAKALAAGMESGIDRRARRSTGSATAGTSSRTPTPAAARRSSNAKFHYALDARSSTSSGSTIR